MAEQMASADNGNAHYDDPTDYPVLLDQVKNHEKNIDKGRYIRMRDRKKESIYSAQVVEDMCQGKFKTAWRGLNMLKDPLDITIYQELVWREKPATIIELGAYTGGSALWLADISKAYGNTCHVYSLDIDLALVDPLATKNPHVTFVQGDCDKIEVAFPPEMMKSLPHPFLIVEDAHINLLGCMEYFHGFMQSGDYFIIEDTSPNCPAVAGQGLVKEMGFGTYGIGKHNTVETFVNGHEEDYAVDSFYTDFFGYNGTFNWNGFIRKIK